MMTDQAIIDELGTTNISVGRRTTGTIRTIVVDRDACIGAQSCVVVLAELFQMDDQNLAYVTDNDHNMLTDDMILLSAESCPVLAIHLYDEHDKKIFPRG